VISGGADGGTEEDFQIDEGMSGQVAVEVSEVLDRVADHHR
jgi:hypothetical protein